MDLHPEIAVLFTKLSAVKGR